jgi:hypothetical protein
MDTLWGSGAMYTPVIQGRLLIFAHRNRIGLMLQPCIELVCWTNFRAHNIVFV